jgi:hypothetical protein
VSEASELELGAALAGACALLALSAGAGALVLPASAGRAPRAALHALAGLALLAAVGNSARSLGLPKPAVLALCYALALAGALRWHFVARRARSAHAGRVEEQVGARERLRSAGLTCALPALVALLALHGSCAIALGHVPYAIDAVGCWWPKLREVGAGLPPDLTTFLPDAHPEYPRGLAWLAALGAPGRIAPDSAVLLVPLLLCVLTCVALHELALQAGQRALAWLVLLTYALLPEVARYAHSGFADLALAPMVLLVGFGLARGREDARWLRVAAVGACGAASIKDEGAVVLAIAAFGLGLVWLRARSRSLESGSRALDSGASAERRAVLSGASAERRAVQQGASAERRYALQALALLLIALPFWWLRVRVSHPGYSAAIPNLLQVEILIERAAHFPNALAAVFFGAPARGILPARAPSTAAWLLAAIALASAFWAARRISAWPAALLAVVYALVLLATPHELDWHVGTTADRLALQLVPLALAALAAGPRESAAPA